MDYLKLFQTHEEYEAFVSGGTMVKPNVSHCVSENDVHYHPFSWADVYFTTVARGSGEISFNILKSIDTDMITSVSYSTDNGATWTATVNQDNKGENLSITVNVNEGDKILWKGIAETMAIYDDDYGSLVGSFFSSTAEFDVAGNVMSLFYGDNYKNQITIEKEGAFCTLFYDYNEVKTCDIVNAKDLSLPATTLAQGCYGGMFYKCTSLTTAPVLPATTLADGCYVGMFNGCTNLTTAPELPATTLAEDCYSNMFFGCTSLVNAPELPATTLAQGCYYQMFHNCTSLVNAPELPATTLAQDCYMSMFSDCTSLTVAPELPATTLASGCYGDMFMGCTSLTTAPELPATILATSCYAYMFANCTSLNYIKAMFTTTPSSTYTNNWVSGVASTGTFVKNSAAQWNVTGVNGIPTNWTVQTATA